MRIRQILILLLLASFISGCWTVHVGKRPESLGDSDLLQSLIGKKSASVVRELGLPNEFLSDGDQRFMLYSARDSDKNIGFFVFFPIGENNRTLHCLRFELDSDNVVKEYRLYSGAMLSKNMVANPYGFISSCREAFWSKQERENLKTETVSNYWVGIEQAEEVESVARHLAKLEQGARKGDADAQLSLFRNVVSEDTNRALGWLCKSADQGHQDARWYLAKIYEYGEFAGVENNVVQQNYKLSYLWLALTGLYDQEYLQSFADRNLTATELFEAENLLREWAPGQCERDLGLVSSTE